MRGIADMNLALIFMAVVVVAVVAVGYMFYRQVIKHPLGRGEEICGIADPVVGGVDYTHSVLAGGNCASDTSSDCSGGDGGGGGD
jgi:hypothetical protein